MKDGCYPEVEDGEVDDFGAAESLGVIDEWMEVKYSIADLAHALSEGSVEAEHVIGLIEATGQLSGAIGERRWE